MKKRINSVGIETLWQITGLTNNDYVYPNIDKLILKLLKFKKNVYERGFDRYIDYLTLAIKSWPEL